MTSVSPMPPPGSSHSSPTLLTIYYDYFRILIGHATFTDTRIYVLDADPSQREPLPRPIEIRPAALDGRKEAAIFRAISGQFLKRDEELCWDQVCELRPSPRTQDEDLGPSSP